MITNFEYITRDLTDLEKKFLPLLIKGFESKTKANPAKADDIVVGINSYLKRKYPESGYKFTEARLRKLCNFIRCRAILPLIATSRGYYLSNDPIEIQNQINSLTERADAIRASADGLRKFLPPSLKVEL